MYGETLAPLWDSVRAELSAFRGLLPLLEADWCLRWAERVLAYDACESGMGACEARADVESVTRLGRVKERLRYRDPVTVEARAHAAATAGAALSHFKVVEEGGELVLLVPESSGATAAAVLAAGGGGFEEVDAGLVAGRRRRMAKSQPLWRHEAIHVKEGRAASLVRAVGYE